jgi:hypothetical protein
MANHSYTVYTIGSLGSEACGSCLAARLSSLEFERMFDERDAVVWSIRVVGPAIIVKDDGRWGACVPLTDKSFAKLKEGILIVEYGDSMHGVSRTIYINGEKAHYEETSIDMALVCGFPIGFKPRSPAERKFFESLIDALEAETRDKLRASDYLELRMKNPTLYGCMERYYASCAAERKTLEAENLSYLMNCSEEEGVEK